MLFYFVVLLVLPLTEAVPSQVTGVSLSVVSGQSAITVNWNKPSSDRPITGYEVKPYTVHGSSFNSESTLLVQRADSLTTVISNLERGTTYAVRVRAVSDAGNGDYSPLPDPIITIPNLMSAPFPTYLPGGGNSRAIITVLVEAILLIIVIVMAVAVVVVKCRLHWRQPLIHLPVLDCYIAASRKEAGAWLQDIPVSSNGLRMEDYLFRVACGLRLGTPLCRPHMFQSCGSPVDSLGNHGLHCRKSVGRHPRHSAINDIVKRSLHGFCQHLGSSGAGGDVPPGRMGRDLMGQRTSLKKERILVWDATCPDAHAPSHLDLALIYIGRQEQWLTRHRSRLKRAKYMQGWPPLTTLFLLGWKPQYLDNNIIMMLLKNLSCRYIRRDSDLNAVEMTQSPAYESVDRVYENANHGQSPLSQQCYLPKNEDYAVIISKVDGSDFNAAEMTQSPAYESVDAAYI